MSREKRIFVIIFAGNRKKSGVKVTLNEFQLMVTNNFIILVKNMQIDDGF